MARRRIYYRLGSYGQPVRRASLWSSVLCRLGFKKSKRVKEERRHG